MTLTFAAAVLGTLGLAAGAFAEAFLRPALGNKGLPGVRPGAAHLRHIGEPVDGLRMKGRGPGQRPTPIGEDRARRRDASRWW